MKYLLLASTLFLSTNVYSLGALQACKNLVNNLSESLTSLSTPKPETLTPIYSRLEFIDEGGMGKVYRGRYPKVDSFLTQKTFPKSYNKGVVLKLPKPDAKEVLAWEALAMKQIKSFDKKNYIPYSAFDKKRNALVVEEIQGENLLKWKEAYYSNPDLPLDPRMIASLNSQLDEISDLLKRSGWVHSDIKLQNIMITRNESFDPPFQLKLIDFGLAAKEGDYPAYLSSLKARGGTITSSSPDQQSNLPAMFSDDDFSIDIIKGALELLLKR